MTIEQQLQKVIHETNILREMISFEGGFGECPSYFGLNDVESISRINTEEPKTGKWVILDECANEGIYCSRCHKKVLKIDYYGCKHYAFERQVGCAYIGKCSAIEGEPTEADAYDPPCGLWEKRGKRGKKDE